MKIFHRMTQQISGSALLLLAGALLITTSCAHIPENPDKSVSFSALPARQGVLADAASTVLDQQEGDISAFMLIPQNVDALNWRLALIDSAQKSIDLQVFIWTNDESGRLLLSRIIAASERGVKVRLLLDDLPKDWSDRVTSSIARAKNIQVRRFNPGHVRKGLIGRTLQMSTQFKTLNCRMHNKQLIVDGCWGIVGSRNIGNPYFGLSKKYNNLDMDLLMAGPIINDLAGDFDEYWNAPAAFPGEAMYENLTKKEETESLQRFRTRLSEDLVLLNQTAIATEPQDWSEHFSELSTNMVYGIAGSLQDSPYVKKDRGTRLEDLLKEAAPAESQVSRLITPYLIPSKEQLNMIEMACSMGREVKLLVPSMEANNHTMVHSHYKKYRKRLLKAGAELYESRGYPSDEVRALSDTSPVKSKFISLHTKAFVLDDSWVALGSLNIDPRSIQINTEHMIVIESSELAGQLIDNFERLIQPDNAWKVSLDENGKLRWRSSAGERKMQPARKTMQRIQDSFYRWLPIESQL